MSRLEVQNFHRVSDRTNVSVFVNPKDLVCMGFPEPHAFVMSASAGVPVCLNLSDQSFPPFVPAMLGERCIGSLRLEDAGLGDMERVFRDVFRAHTGGAGQLPRGSA